MDHIAIVMPQLGRLKQARNNAARMSMLAGYPHRLYIVHPPDETEFWAEPFPIDRANIECVDSGDKTTFWEKMNFVLPRIDVRRVVWVGNDALAGTNWLANLAPYREPFVVSINDGVHYGALAAHAMVHRDLLDRWYEQDEHVQPGTFPDVYKQQYGDTEMCVRARIDGCYRYEPNAVLYHAHPVNGFLSDDVYKLGGSNVKEMQALFTERIREYARRHGQEIKVEFPPDTTPQDEEAALVAGGGI